VLFVEDLWQRIQLLRFDCHTHTISSRGFLKNNGIMPDETTRYAPEWDEDLGGDAIDGGFRINLDQDEKSSAWTLETTEA